MPCSLCYNESKGIENRGISPLYYILPNPLQSWAEKEPAEQGRGILPGFGLEVSWKGSPFLGEIFSFSRRKTFISCPGSEKLQACSFSSISIEERGVRETTIVVTYRS